MQADVDFRVNKFSTPAYPQSLPPMLFISDRFQYDCSIKPRSNKSSVSSELVDWNPLLIQTAV